MVEYLRKFENRGITIGWVNSILITKYNNLLLFTLIYILKNSKKSSSRKIRVI